MTIESYRETEQDKKIILKVEKGLKEALFKISSRKKYILASFIDNMDLNLAKRVSRMVGLSETEIQDEIDKGRTKNYHS
jgi:hypothetical protein